MPEIVSKMKVSLKTFFKILVLSSLIVNQKRIIFLAALPIATQNAAAMMASAIPLVAITPIINEINALKLIFIAFAYAFPKNK